MQSLDTIGLDITVILGTARMPVHRLLRMGRGAIIELSSHENDEVEILANNHPIALGQIVVNGTRIAVEITQLLGKSSKADAAAPEPPEASAEAA